jgi:glycolate oxidase iron-sulfur subunit
MAAGRGAPLPGELLPLDGLRRCVHCGICLPVCPTYELLGEEMDSPRGRLYLIRAAVDGRVDLSPTLARHLELCLGCRACESACPAGVPFGHLLEATRAELGRRRLGHAPRWLERLLYGLLPHPRRFGAVVWLLRLSQRTPLPGMVRRSGWLRRHPHLAALVSLLPPLPRARRLPRVVGPRGPRRGRAGLLSGCVERYLFPQVHRDAAWLLSLGGWEVRIPRSQGCCGALDLHQGRLDVARERARALARAFAEVDVVVTTAAGCGAAMKSYAHWEPALAGWAARVRDVSQLLVDASLPLGRLELTVTYHDACHLAHGQGIRSEPRALLSRIPGLRLVPLAESELCCGSAGVYNLLEPEMADRLLDLKVARIAETGARVVAAANPGCLLQIAKGCRRHGIEVEVRHPVELLARAVAAAGERP